MKKRSAKKDREWLGYPVAKEPNEELLIRDLHKAEAIALHWIKRARKAEKALKLANRPLDTEGVNTAQAVDNIDGIAD